jgi:two-component system, OmpR family, response regulator MtrA
MVELTTGALAAEALTLTRLERRLLLRMAAEPDAVIGYSELAECVWGRPGADAHDRAALRQHIAMLRRKLALLRAEISTVASVGYRFKFGCADDSADHT